MLLLFIAHSSCDNTQIPINRPICPVFNNQRNSIHRMTINSSTVNYHPNRFDAPKPAAASAGGYVHQAAVYSPAVKQRLLAPKFAEHYDQGQLFYNSMTPVEKQHIAEALKFELSKVRNNAVVAVDAATVLMHYCCCQE